MKQRSILFTIPLKELPFYSQVTKWYIVSITFFWSKIKIAFLIISFKYHRSMGALNCTAQKNQHIIFPAKIALSLSIFFFNSFPKVAILSGTLGHQGCLL